MKKATLLSLGLIGLAVLSIGRLGQAQEPTAKTDQEPRLTADGQLLSPKNYRDWVFLSSGLGMTYGPISAAGATAENPRFENVFVNPPAYRAFLETGAWPDNTVLVLEIRASASKLSINKNGRVQQEIVGLEVEVKDSKRFHNKWAFFDLSNAVASAKPIERSASCYACHGTNGAVDNTFVQFYPTLIKIARDKGTFHESALE